MATLRELIIKISANSQSFQTEIQRASRLGQNYYKTMQDGGRKASSATRETQQALAAVSSQLSETKRAATGLAGAFAGAFATGHLITLADEWNSVNARLKQASTSTEDFSNSQRALMEISQKTGTAFSDNAGLFARSSASMREFGYSSAEVLKVTEAVSTGLKLSGASTAEASSVITQLSQALAQGVLRGEEFNSVNENGDRIIRALAAGMGVARKDLKAMADQGLLTIDKVVPAITSQLQAMQGEFEAMPKTVSGSFQKVENSFMQWVGGANDAYGASATLAGGLESLADNIDTVATAAGVLTAVGVSRYFGNWTQQLKTQTEQLIAARTEEISLTAAKIEGANASLAQITADKAMLVTNQQSLVAQLELATTEKQRTAIRGLLAKNSADLVKVNRSEIATVNALAAANQRLNAMTSITRTAWAGVSSLFGGIPGILMLGAGAWYAWYQNQEQARQSAIQYASTLDGVVEKAKEMSEIQLRGSISDSGASIDALKDKLEDLRDKQDEAAASIAEYTKLARQLGVEHDQNNGYVRNAAKAQREYNQISRDIADTTAQLNKVVESQNKLQDELASKVSVSGAAFRKIQQDIQNAINVNDAMAASMSVTIQFMDEMRKKSGGVTGQPEINNSAYDKFIKQQKESIALSQREGVERAKLKALQDAIRQGAIRTDNSGAVLPGQEKQIAAIQSNAATDFNLLESQKKPRGKTAEQKTEDVYNRLIKQQKEQIALQDQSTELAKVTYQVSQGELAALTEAQKKTVLQNAALIDQVKLREQLRNYEASLADSNASARAANDAQLIGYGQGTRFRERMQEQFNIRKEFEQKNTDLLRQRQADQINENVYQQELALNKRYLEERLRDQEGYYAASDAQRDDWMTGLSEGYANWVDEATDYSSMAADGMKQAMGGAVTTITDMLNGNVDSWKDWGISVLKIVENVAINMALANGVSSLGSFFSFGASSAAAASSGTAIQNAGANFTFNAKGNVYDSPSLSAYSNGVFQTPQLFAFAKGAGIFGEAGPEAIMPLTRAPNGDLAVRAVGMPQVSGGVPSVNFGDINIQGGSSQAASQGTAGAAGRQLKDAITGVINEQASMPGSPLWRLIKGV
ncbi:phage tail tape measure protein [Enterobacter hormaechei]|uniref:phage tail tape measure protein n=1 Tax=Enterobacter hormaechei TaxID=158836 RepID=UPI0007354BE4|nr:phage tail tape measure protein [Enterobacter hormaechei]HAS1740304.1 phage tail tape measure protein [Enterobacter hormaechei subsp. oharae]KTG95726.1 phage tail tape measure protein [Enterobacter hormaechei subsp. xiangfangensis]KTH01388.1 phage tail tape measure protein [Enterobacter hormaechei subsp. xiangfangensis]KTI03006.1 phage tail tape measure protein [Enterobacter hormaechei subsp. xiangfangensis]KTI89730.1 phage tail tape measure protein [Enterobacter hormaechei subsp. xiangfang